MSYPPNLQFTAGFTQSCLEIAPVNVNILSVVPVVPVVPVVLGNFSSVRTIQTNGFLPYSNRLPWNTGNSQLSDFSIQIMEKEQRPDFWSTAVRYPVSYEGNQHGSDFIQDTEEGQYYNDSQNFAGLALNAGAKEFFPKGSEITPKKSQLNDGYAQPTVTIQPPTYLLHSTETKVSPESYQSSSDFVQDTEEGQYYKYSQNFAGLALNAEAKEFFPKGSEITPKKSQLNDGYAQPTVTMQPPTYLLHSTETKVSPESTQPSSDFIQDIEEGQNFNFLSTPAEVVASPKSYQRSRDPVQATVEKQSYNSWSTHIMKKVSPESTQPSSGFVQDIEEGQNFNFWPTPAEVVANPKSYQRSRYPVQATVEKQSSNSWSTHITKKFTRFSNNTQQKKLETDNAVNIFIQNITKLRGLKNTSLSIQIMEIFNTFKQHVNTSYLTNDHRKQFLTIIPTISKIIDKKDLSAQTTANILHTLARTMVCCKLNSDHRLVDEFIQYEQACRNLISQILATPTDKTYTPRSWSNLIYAVGELASQSPNLITTETINNLVVTFNTQKHSLTKFNPQDISNIFTSVSKLLQLNKLDSKSSDTYSFIEYLFKQIKPVISDFNPKSISDTIFAIAKLLLFPEITQIISKNRHIIELLLQEIVEDINLNWKAMNISMIFFGLGQIVCVRNLSLSGTLSQVIRSAYNMLYNKIPSVESNIDVEMGDYILFGIIMLIRANIIIDDKPSEDFIRRIFLNKIIADHSIMNSGKLYCFLYTMSFFQEYLTKKELIKIIDNIKFFTPDVINLKMYFSGMGHLLVKIRKEIDNDRTDKKLFALEALITTQIKITWEHFKFNIINFDHGIKRAMHNTCSLVDEIKDLYLLPVNYIFKEKAYSALENDILAIIKTLMLNPESLKREYHIDKNLSPVDACIIYPDRSMVAIEIQGPGHYIDNKAEHPTGKHLLKIARLQKANIKVIEINPSKLMAYRKSQKFADYLINILLENHVEIRSEYKNNLPRLLQDAGMTP